MDDSQQKPSGPLRGVRCRLQQAVDAMSYTEELQAVDLYTWPTPLRFVGYATALSALAGVYLGGSWPGLGEAAILFGLWAVYTVGFHVVSQHWCPLPFIKRFAVVLIQLGVASTLIYLRYAFGPEILFYMLAAELQFLLSFRAAIAGTAILWGILAAMAWIAAPSPLKSIMAEVWLITPAGFIFVAAFTRSAVTELVQRRRSTMLLDELNDAHHQLQAYASRVEELTITRERNRMAREIHDTLGHYLTVINVQIETAQKLRGRDAERAEDALRNAKQLATDCLSEVRRSVAALRPAALDDLPLPEALAQLARDIRKSTNLIIHMESHGEGSLRNVVEETVYRAIQEALTNVRKHAGARNVWIHMEWNPERFVAHVRDDGRGSPALPAGGGPSSFGLRGMRERMARVGGSVEIETAPGSGFRVALHVPHPTEAVAPAEPVAVGMAGGQ